MVSGCSDGEFVTESASPALPSAFPSASAAASASLEASSCSSDSKLRSAYFELAHDFAVSTYELTDLPTLDSLMYECAEEDVIIKNVTNTVKIKSTI